MPTTIPFDPALSLTNYVDPERLAILEEISEAQVPIDVAEEKLNSNISALESYNMTVRELTNLGIEPPADEGKKAELEKAISDSAMELFNARMEGNNKISEIKSKSPGITSDSIESPVDYTSTQIKYLPLSSNSLKLNAQYFSHDENEQGAENTSSKVSNFLKAEYSGWFHPDVSTSVSHTTNKHISQQKEHHDIDGTLVISLLCTHEKASVLAPCVLDIDKAISGWNDVNKGNDDKLIKLEDPSAIQSSLVSMGADDESLHMLSGITYGSSFVGMVHMLDKSSTVSSQKMESSALSAQLQIKANMFFQSLKGAFGHSSSSSSDEKNLLSIHDVESHISVVTTGIIPTIASTQLDMGVKSFAKFDPQSMMDQLSVMDSSTQSSMKSLEQEVSSSKKKGEISQVDANNKHALMSGLDTSDKRKNSVLNTESMMTAMDDFVKQAQEIEGGVPISFYLKPIKKYTLLKGWMDKYHPGWDSDTNENQTDDTNE